MLLITSFYKSESLKCVMDSYNWCSFTNVNVTATHRFFQPTYDYPYVVEKVRFYDSHLEILTDELCTSFYNLRELEIWNTKLRKIEAGALDNCLRLQWASFWSNHLRKLDAKVFQRNQQLKTLNVQKNQLKTIKPEIFNGLSELRHLSLNDNYLRTFPVYEMTFLDSLETLQLDTNELTDLDEQEVLYKFPNLKLIYLNDNPLMCDRLRAILGTFRRNGVSVSRWGHEHRLREFNLNTFFEGDCLSEDLYGSSRLKQEINSLKQHRNHDSKPIIPDNFNRLIRNFQDIQKNTEHAIFELNLDLDEVMSEIKELKFVMNEFNATLEHIQHKIHFTNVDLSELADEFHIINSTQEVLFKMIEGIEVAVEEIRNQSYQHEWNDLMTGNDLTNIS